MRLPLLIKTWNLNRSINKIGLKSVVLLLTLFLFTGCIEIVEDITVHADRSGTVSYRLETSGAGGFINGLASLLDVSVEDNVRREAEKLIRALQDQEGISNIGYNLGGRSGIYFLQFDFSNYRSLNDALYAISGNQKTFFSPGYIKIGRSRIRKLNFSPLINKYIQKEGLELPSPLITDNIIYKSVIRTPADIKRVRSGVTANQKSPRQTMQKFMLTEVINGEVNTGIKVRY